jgi:hypothetical protein
LKLGGTKKNEAVQSRKWQAIWDLSFVGGDYGRDARLAKRESQKRHTHTGYDGGKALVTGACHQTGRLAEGHRQSVSKHGPLAQIELGARVLNQLRKGVDRFYREKRALERAITEWQG